jgi:hypothetical protein
MAFHRSSTVIHDAYQKKLLTRITNYDYNSHPFISEFIEKNNSNCAYCGSENCKLTKDHYLQSIRKKSPNKLSNWSNFTLKSCQSCNSKKKDGKQEFIDNSKNPEFLQELDKLIESTIIYYSIDLEEYESRIQMMEFTLQYLDEFLSTTKIK